MTCKAPMTHILHLLRPTYFIVILESATTKFFQECHKRPLQVEGVAKVEHQAERVQSLYHANQVDLSQSQLNQGSKSLSDATTFRLADIIWFNECKLINPK